MGTDGKTLGGYSGLHTCMCHPWYRRMRCGIHCFLGIRRNVKPWNQSVSVQDSPQFFLSYYPNKAYMMKSPVTSLLSLLPLLASFSVSPLPEKWQSSGCWQEVSCQVLCQQHCVPITIRSPAVGDSIIYKKIQAYVIRGNLSLCMVIQKVYVKRPTNSSI